MADKTVKNSDKNTNETKSETKCDADGGTTRENKPSRTARAGEAVAAARVQIARIVKIVFTVIAAMLAIGALLVALRHNLNTDNPIVQFITGFDDVFDGPFSRDGGLFAFQGKHHVTLDALVNWGIAALIYLVIGRVLERLIRP